MAAYSVAEAKERLPRLIRQAAAGEAVVITRHGKPVAELRPCAGIASKPPAGGTAALYDWLRSRRTKLPAGAPSSVELLDRIYEEAE